MLGGKEGLTVVFWKGNIKLGIHDGHWSRERFAPLVNPETLKRMATPQELSHYATSWIVFSESPHQGKNIFSHTPSVHWADSKNSCFSLFLFLPKVCSLQQVQWEHNCSGCSCGLNSVQQPPTLCLCKPLFWDRWLMLMLSVGILKSLVIRWSSRI